MSQQVYVSQARYQVPVQNHTVVPSAQGTKGALQCAGVYLFDRSLARSGLKLSTDSLCSPFWKSQARLGHNLRLPSKKFR
jgi:hypothetical protein